MDIIPVETSELLKSLKIEHLKVIGQSAEKAVIFCYHIKKRRILCFDQHALDERVRYENILKTCKNIKLDEAKSLACHGAIRFGDILTMAQCYNLMSKVLKCQTPFRCAHLRSSVCVLDSLDKLHYLDKIRQHRVLVKVSKDSTVEPKKVEPVKDTKENQVAIDEPQASTSC